MGKKDRTEWAQSAIPRTIALHKCSPCFNPRARVGRDAAKLEGRTHQGCFNPRARVGRDVRPRRAMPVSWCFNPRARVGRDC
jgi:hypothetical protein